MMVALVKNIQRQERRKRSPPPFSPPTYTTTFFFTLLMPGFPINDLPMSYISSSLTTSFPFTTSTM